MAAPAPPRDPQVARLAEALGLPEERVARALAGAGRTPEALLRAVQAGMEDEDLQALARSLRVGRERLAAAVLAMAQGGLDDAAGAAGPVEGLAAAARGAAEEALAIGLEIVGESVPKVVNQFLAAMAAAGVALVALGLLAVLNTPMFVQLLAIIAGLALIASGALFFFLAWRLHEATASLRTLARVARKWRGRRAAARDAEP